MKCRCPTGGALCLRHARPYAALLVESCDRSSESRSNRGAEERRGEERRGEGIDWNRCDTIEGVWIELVLGLGAWGLGLGAGRKGGRGAMDKEPEEMQYLGVVGVIKEAFKLMRSYGRLLASLTATLVLPLCFVMLAHHLLSDPLMDTLKRQQDRVVTMEGTAAGDKLKATMDRETVVLLVMGILYVLFVLAFSLLSFAAIVYSVACIYTGKGVSYSKVLSVVPKVWKRLMITLLWSYLIMFAYQLSGIAVFVVLIILFSSLSILVPVLFLTAAVFLVILVYIVMIWDMASVVSVLEKSFGLGALKKSVQVLKGKRLTASCLVVLFWVPNFVISSLFQSQVVHSSGSLWGRVFYAALLVSLFSALWMMSVVVKSVLYFVCKAYHHETDRYVLSELLDGYLGEYMPLKDPIPLETLEA
ncbi:hypothetical protein MPTK1_1g08740 [Marchantia polymorpha subsp. ruderalis]|uniref:Uncharacterized protein n=2 Tax=Marchantia polymorpha TaxID=3197 RepID=A0AAF6AN18_MARPO|nr:hypothetical protein MARPO_0036s0117 [Marchantia polymorpha]BBM97838.1 hypothetical protein Mp_1g08740 [Marchantia polymorpha subsp. ruderalis]|eukprot:PTQ41141.1 hypothetical protein MARPO_0036s0117 [Marchantia polymorpha]